MHSSLTKYHVHYYTLLLQEKETTENKSKLNEGWGRVCYAASVFHEKIG